MGTTGLSWVPVHAMHRRFLVLCASKAWKAGSLPGVQDANTHRVEVYINGKCPGSGLLMAPWPPARLPWIFPLLLLGRQIFGVLCV